MSAAWPIVLAVLGGLIALGVSYWLGVRSGRSASSAAASEAARKTAGDLAAEGEARAKASAARAAAEQQARDQADAALAAIRDAKVLTESDVDRARRELAEIKKAVGP